MAAKPLAGLSNFEVARILNFGDHGLAVRSAQAALRARPADGKLWQLLAVGLAALGRVRDAQAALRCAMQLLPGDAELLANAQTLRLQAAAAQWQALNEALQSGDKPGALRLARRALHDEPGLAAHHNNLSVALAAGGQLAEAVEAGRRAVELDPDAVQYRINLAAFLSLTGRGEEALRERQQVFARAPDDVETCRLLAHEAAQRGDPTRAAFYCRSGREAYPRDLSLHSQLLYYMSLDAAVSPADSLAAHVAWGQRVVAEVGGPAFAFPNDRDAARRLRVGFVSADLHTHPVAGFIEPVWAALDRDAVQLWVYAAGAAQDAVTERLRPLAHAWRDVHGLSDAELAKRIHEDGIDVLFDLSGHTSGHRLPCFAMKPAPIQVTWIGYPNTTGLAAMDYALCDRFNAPPGLYEQFYVEKFARIPCSGTFSPLGELPDVAPLPALARGSVCFGSFNVLRKIGPDVLSAWARVLHGTPGSTLLVGHVAQPQDAAWLRREFAAHGIAEERLRLVPPMELPQYLALHAEVDLLLDTWPYTGGTTTNYALAMGVPVVTLSGPGRAHCQSAGVLGRIGLQDWVAADVDRFVALATARAQDLASLSAVRAGLRERWQATPRRQPRAVAHGLERAVRAMWQRWCAGLPAEHFEVEDA